MPSYEMPLLLRLMSKTQISSTLKRTAQTIFKNGGFIRKIENLGKQVIPYRISAHGSVFREANYFIFYFDAPPQKLYDLCEEYGRDVDIIKNKIYKTNEVVNPPCTLEDEMKPPPYRPDVQRMIELGKKQQKKRKFDCNSGLSFYPFQK